VTATHVDCSSLEGKREIDDVFGILSAAVMVGSSNKFVLREIGDGGILLSTVYERGAPGTFKPGRYIIGKLHSICFLAMVLILSQSLRKMERKFSEEKR
jgi:hypothetical protein